ncbi:MAG TPA: hypothetical protein VKU93_06275 [Terracidiphilus sp.]|jgi:hypothetical protein|nr:hypothetical protein [Terracidiphilus sp.]
MRTQVRLTVLLALGIALAPVYAYASDNKVPDEQSIAALEARANQAQPREQPFLYAELVHQMTELSVRQYAAGNVAKAVGLLQRIQALATKIHLSLASNDKRLKNAEILLSNTAFRLNEMLHASDFEDRQVVQQTLAKVNDAQDEAMMTVFEK